MREGWVYGCAVPTAYTPIVHPGLGEAQETDRQMAINALSSHSFGFGGIISIGTGVVDPFVKTRTMSSNIGDDFPQVWLTTCTRTK